MTRRAFTLLEVLFAIPVVVLFLLVAGWGTTLALRISREVPVQLNQSRFRHTVSQQLHTDIFSATAFSTPAPNVLFLTTPGGELCWTLTPAGDITRSVLTSPPTSRLHVGLFPNATFRIESPHIFLESDTLRLSFTSEPARQSELPPDRRTP